MAWAVQETNTFQKNQNKLSADFETYERTLPENNHADNKHLFHVFSQEQWRNYQFADKESLKWFEKAKYGLFICLGLSALGKVDIGWPKFIHKLPDTGNGSIPDEVYDNWANEIAFQSFNAREWIELAKKGGMKYVVIIAKHHDGFHMWDTKFSEHKITNSPFGRDYLKELIDACHELDMKVGVYYSQRDWYHPDYEPLEKTTFEKAGCRPPYKNNANEKIHISDKHKRYIEYMHNTVLELMTNYGKIDILWWDSVWWGGMFEEEMWDTIEIEKKVRELQPNIIINNRGSVPGDFDTPECTIGFFQNHRPWESCMPLCNAWAWNGSEAKPLKRVISDLVNCACGNGNYLLSIGATPAGQIDKPEMQRIVEVGKWLEKYGESIYDTNGGPWLPDVDYGCTFKENIIYIHIINEKAKKIILPKIKNDIVNINCLTGQNVNYHINGERLFFEIDNNDEIDTIIKLTMKDIVEIENR